MRPTQPRISTLCGWLAGLNPAIEIIRKFLENGIYANNGLILVRATVRKRNSGGATKPGRSFAATSPAHQPVGVQAAFRAESNTRLLIPTCHLCLSRPHTAEVSDMQTVSLEQAVAMIPDGASL